MIRTKGLKTRKKQAQKAEKKGIRNRQEKNIQSTNYHFNNQIL